MTASIPSEETSNYLCLEKLKNSALTPSPYPHLIIDNFIRPEKLRAVCDGFPDITQGAVFLCRASLLNVNSLSLSASSKVQISATALLKNLPSISRIDRQRLRCGVTPVIREMVSSMLTLSQNRSQCYFTLILRGLRVMEDCAF